MAHTCNRLQRFTFELFNFDSCYYTVKVLVYHWENEQDSGVPRPYLFREAKPRDICLVKGNQNLANTEIMLLLFYHTETNWLPQWYTLIEYTETNIKLWDVQVNKSNVVALLSQLR